jgi:hypothetical protein
MSTECGLSINARGKRRMLEQVAEPSFCCHLRFLLLTVLAWKFSAGELLPPIPLSSATSSTEQGQA